MVSEQLRSSWSLSCLAHHGDLWSSQWSKLQKLHRLSFTWTKKNSLLYPFRCVEWKAASVRAAEIYGPVIPSNRYVPENSAVVYSWNTSLEQCVVSCHVKKLACFYEQLNHFSLSTITYCELRWFDIFDSFSFVQPIRSLNILCVFMLCKSTAQGSGSFLPIYFNLKILHLFMFHWGPLFDLLS